MLFRRWQRQAICLINCALLSIVLCNYAYSSSRQAREAIARPVTFCEEHKPSITYSNLLYIPSMNILFCNIPKTASTNLRRVLHAHLFPNLNASRSRRIPNRTEVWIELERDFEQYYLRKRDDLEALVTNETLTIFKFLLVRHPFRRIYSAFNDKFVHEHVDDTRFGWRQLEEEILLQMHSHETVLSLRRRDIRLDFRTFLRFLVDSIRQQQPINSHWDQIVTRCGICQIDYDWVGKVENLQEDGPKLLKKLKGASEQGLQFPSWQLDAAEHNGTTHLNDEQLVQLFRETLKSESDFRTLLDYYEPDFQAFKYSMPDE